MTRTINRDTDSASTGKATYSAPAFEKAADIIELLANAPDGLSISDIAANLERSLGELFRIVMVMERRGFLQRDSQTERYCLSYKLLDLSMRATPAKKLLRAAEPVMRTLARKIEQSCHIAVPNGNSVLVIANNESPRPGGYLVRLGVSADLFQSCSGLVFLAFSGPDYVERALNERPKRQAFSAGARTEFGRVLEETRKRGFVLQSSPAVQGITEIGYPIRGYDGRVLASLTIPFLQLIDGSQRVQLDDACKDIGAAVREISAALGWSGAPPQEQSVIKSNARRRRRSNPA